MKSSCTSNLLSMMGGAAIGAGLMYLMDPDAGARRREELARSASQRAHGAGQALGATWQGLGKTAHHTADAFRSAGQSASEHGRDWAQSLSASARRLGQSASEHVPAMLHRKPAPKTDLLSDVLLVAGGLAAGAGLMMLLDPQQGRRRRALIRDKVVRGMNETRDLAQRTGRYMTDHARGYAADARSLVQRDQAGDEQLAARVRSELGRVVGNIAAVSVTARDGCITLGGEIAEHERQRVTDAVRAIRGVRDVDCRLAGDTTSMSQGASATSTAAPSGL